MYRVALFDIDGTLCDPGDTITSAARYALSRLGIEENDEAALRTFVGPPLEHTFRDRYGLDPDGVARATALYRERFAARGLAGYRAYPGVEAVLEHLAAAGVRLGVVTAKFQPFAERALEITGLRPYFATVTGRAPDEVVAKAVTLRTALSGVAQPRATVVMIGDREHDVEAARENGVDSIGVLYGYGTRAELTAAGATHLAAEPSDVEPIVLAGPVT